jgi:type II secretory pathway component PulF
MFSSRIRLKPLAQLCHRLATATNAGIQDRKIWTDEAERGSASQREVAAGIRDQLARGQTMTDALRKTGDYFPAMYRQMVEVGEISGRLGDIYKRLGRNYDRVLASRRLFLGKLMWPVFQLGMALLVIGILIYIMGMIPNNQRAGAGQIDILGWGLVGPSGLFKYITILIILAIGGLLLFQWLRNREDWIKGLMRVLVSWPIIGKAVKTLAIAKFTWALQLVLDTPMDIRKALTLAFNATDNGYFSQHTPQVLQQIERGQSITQSLASMGVFPADFLDTFAVGEESGRLVEAMQRASEDYEERAASAISIIAQFAGYAIWLVIAIFIIFMIFRIFSFYLDTLNSLM